MEPNVRARVILHNTRMLLHCLRLIDGLCLASRLLVALSYGVKLCLAGNIVVFILVDHYDVLVFAIWMWILLVLKLI
jgi:hypothetical protein